MRKDMFRSYLKGMTAIFMAFAIAFAVAGCSSGGASSDDSGSADATAEESQEQEEREADSVSGAEDEGDGEETEEVEEEPASEAVEAHLNEAISTEEYDIEFVDAHWEEADSEGKWVYYKGDHITRSMSVAADSHIFVVRATITNKAAAAIQPSFYCRGEALVNNKYEYDVMALSESGTSDISPLETADVLLYVEIPPAMKDQFEDIDIKWGFSIDEYPQSLEEVYEVYDLYFK